MPALTSDGQLVWAPGARRGVSVLTANGIEFRDWMEQPQPAVRKSPYEPYKPATGFLMPSDGRWHRTAQPVHFRTELLAVTLRTSDALVPAWGGELLVELSLASSDTLATLVARRKALLRQGALGALPVAVRLEDRPPLRLILIMDDVSEATAKLAGEALAGLGSEDQVAVIDSRGSHVVLPFLPCEYHSLFHGALRRRMIMKPQGSAGRDLSGSVALVQRWIEQDPAPDTTTAVLVVTEESVEEEILRRLRAVGVRVEVATPEVLRPERRAVLDSVLPESRGVSLKEVKVVISSSPAPAHVIEATAGQIGSLLDEDELYLDELEVGQRRTELLRVTVPPFVQGETYRLSVRVEARDAVTGALVIASHRMVLRYTDDIEALSREQSGDVLAYASALAMVQRLDRSLFGEAAEQPEGLRRLVAWQQRALVPLLREAPALERRARLLEALSWSLDP
ncbi:MAG: hypothetical protein RMJ98_02640 [Myxococcales bacterium]|nr:hypothetical protein [Polyangiaceae bacterium]MDW8248187.1 hypothetical protein [Myxococcales bacterium]